MARRRRRVRAGPGGHPLIAALPINFVGNVEGKDVFRGGCDVVVTDGFTGNVVLKVAEGIGEFLFASIAREARKSVGGKVGGALLGQGCARCETVSTTGRPAARCCSVSPVRW